jgi:hypothetical protein
LAKAHEGLVRRRRNITAVRKEALRTLIPHVHWLAHVVWVEDEDISRELRSLGDRMNVLTQGTPAALAAFWGAAILVN